ncbi:hypothetical protein VNO78_27901 [Psophocarpus tetragonolobus]|uniref:Gnk2-homologous domain-containing protein n=1 Tax=Psophocarpus tetragonolobus TaxID=3891 RepID=A0AAN9XBS8_PSOTE
MLELKLLAFLTLIWCCTNDIIVDGNLLINEGCSAYNVTNMPSFLANLNEMFQSLRAKISNQKKHFAIEEKTRGDVLTYAIFQCRNYLSQSDCVDCFNTASTQIRNCYAANGARAIYDDCFLRYESDRFYEQTTLPGNGVSCGNTSTSVTDFRVVVQHVLTELQTATPKIKGFYAATKTQVAGGAIYAVAQCVETAIEPKCLDCLHVGYKNLQTCLPNTEGKAYDAGCFMRYSTTPFFADNHTINLSSYFKQGGSNKKWTIIGGVVGGAAVLLVLFLLKLTTISKRNDREIISGQKSTNVKSSEDEPEYLLQRAWKLYERDLHLELLEETINHNEYNVEEVKKIIEIALLCTQALAIMRPTMSEIVLLLKSKNTVENLQPTMPVVVGTSTIPQEGNSMHVVVGTNMMTQEDNFTSLSNATASISIPSAR